MSCIDLTTEQKRARDGIVRDYYAGNKTITLGGLAGTGKTTLIRELVDLFPTHAVMAFTGKASSVLRNKGIEAATIHSTIYLPPNEEDSRFRLRPYVDVSGFIVDEASMVSDTIYRDILSFGKSCIFVGDHGQLEPVGSSFNLMANPQYRLETIHRNSGDIARFAMHLREGNDAGSFVCEDGTVEFIEEASPHLMAEVDQVICAFNKSRTKANAAVRDLRSYYSVVHKGEKVICLRNNRKHGLFNGQQGIVTKANQTKLTVDSDGMVYAGIPYIPTVFGGGKLPEYNAKDHRALFDHAYCITAHKAQGGEFDEVLVLEERSPLWSHARWAYTAASRARKKLIWKLEGAER